MPTGFWRGVGPNNNVFAIESFIDELARKAGKDPVAFRRAMLKKTPRLLAALDLSRKNPAGARRCRRAKAAASPCRCPSPASSPRWSHVEVGDQGDVRLHRLTTAVDTGIAVNPDTIVAQLQGGMIFGRLPRSMARSRWRRAACKQSNFHDYRMLRIDQAPAIDVHLIKSGESPAASGKPG